MRREPAVESSTGGSATQLVCAHNAVMRFASGDRSSFNASYVQAARGDTPGSDRLITGTTQQILCAGRNSAPPRSRPGCAFSGVPPG